MEETQSGSEVVRRLHIVYFLSRKGRIEHPHLLRVHHHSRNGVRLRDVKRWLGELRGKDMPQLFAWSYKRKYKTGYVWQDLLDDDLITPVSDNEFVLKGSEVSSSALNTEFSYSEKELLMQKGEAEAKDMKNSSKEENQSHSSETSMYISTKSSSEIEEESPTFGSETSTLTDETANIEKNPDTIKDEKQEAEETIDNPFYSKLLSKKSNRKSNKVKINEKVNTYAPAPAPAPASSDKSTTTEQTQNKSKSNNSNGATNVFRNFITCGAIDTYDSAVVMMNKHNNRPSFMNMCSGDENNVCSAEICKRDNKLGGSQRVLGNPNWTQRQWSGRKSCDGGVKDSNKNKSDQFRDQKALYAASAAYKPINGPNCSQCGKQFKPEKMHSHMKSCKGMKAMSKGATATNPAMATATAETTSKKSTGSQNDNSTSGYLLTH